MRALPWALQWFAIAFGGAIVMGLSLDGRLELLAQPARTLARTGTILAAVALATPLYFAVEFWVGVRQWARRQYPRDFAGKLILLTSAIVVAAALLYSSVAFRVLRLTWRTLDRWSLSIPVVPLPVAKPHWWYALLLAPLTIVAARYLFPFIPGTIRNYKRSLRGLGVRRFLRGIPLMVLLRLRQPRRDFFMHTPVIGEVLIYAFAAGLAAAIPIRIFALALASLVAALGVLLMLDKLRPPTLLFLGASEFDSFRAFHRLRQIWGPTAVTLLDRENQGGREFYDLQRTAWSRGSAMPRGLFYDPTVPRVWSFRTRPARWASTVLLLVEYAPVVVVDLRFPSQYVWHEVRALAELALVEKAWFLAGDDGPHPTFADALPTDARLVTEEELVAHSERINEAQRDVVP